jgi:hypothetical protein
VASVASVGSVAWILVEYGAKALKINKILFASFACSINFHRGYENFT